MSIPVITVNQGDFRWKDIVMSPSKLTIGGYGCLASAICASLPVYGIRMAPGDFFRKLVSVGGFDADGNLIHQSIEKIDQNLVFYERLYTTNSTSKTQKNLVSAVIDRAKNLLSLGQPVMLEVDNVGQDGVADHWVCAWDYKDGDFLVMNPDGGNFHKFSERYGDPVHKLYGIYTILGPSHNFPDWSSDERRKAGLAAWKAAMVWKGKNVSTYSREILDALI